MRNESGIIGRREERGRCPSAPQRGAETEPDREDPERRAELYGRARELAADRVARARAVNFENRSGSCLLGSPERLRESEHHVALDEVDFDREGPRVETVHALANLGIACTPPGPQHS